jgi:predicted secreted protein
MRFDLMGDNEEEGLSIAASDPDEESAAEAFASELLASRQLISQIRLRHNWVDSQISNASIIYQLSLRLGLSFKASCWALARNGMIRDHTAQQIADETEVNELKTALIPRSLLQDPWADVWILTGEDAGYLLEGGPNDIFAIEVKDNASAGFLWQLGEPDEDFEAVLERIDISQSYGADSARVLLFRAKSPGTHRLALEHKRPWSGQSQSSIEISIVNYGKEVEGLPRHVKRERLLVR